MFFPISDDNPSSSTPYVTYLLIGLCSFVFILQYLSQMNPSIFYNFGFIPADFFSNYSSFTIYTSMFLHGGFFHIAGNMLYLWIFGDNVEDSMGTVKFIIFYLLCGTIAALCQGLVDPSSEIPMVGASGAIAGVLLTAMLGAAAPNAAGSHLLTIIAAIILGGTSLYGGIGSVWGTLFAVLILGTINNGLTLMNVSSSWQEVAKGTVLILAVGLDQWRMRA